MWTPLLFCLVVGLATAENAWKPAHEYKYNITGRTLASLNQVADQYVGVVSNAILTLAPKSANVLWARITDPKYSQVHANLTGGWASPIPAKELKWRPLPFSSKPFEIKYKKGVVDQLVLSKELSTAEVNLVKSVVSQLQVDINGTNEIRKHKPSEVPELDAHKSVYRTMEDTVTGECEVMYDVSPLPEYAILSMPSLAPVKSLRGEGQFYDILKTKNFSNCDKRVAYHYGFSGLSEFEPGDNRIGSFLSRSSVSRIVISGTLKKYTIQSSVTTAKIVLSPALYNAQKGMVGSRMNVTLMSVRPSLQSYPDVPNPRIVKDLVYQYNTPFSSETKAKGEDSSSESESESSSSNDSDDSSSGHSESGSSTSESSDDESDESRKVPKRFRRSPPKKKYDSSGSSSSSSENDSDDSVSNGASSSSSESSSESASHSGNSASSSSSSSSSSQSSSTSEESSSSSSSSSSSDSSSSSSSDSSSSSSSDSSEEHQDKPTMPKPPQIPLLPYFVGYEGYSIQADKNLDAVTAAKKLCYLIAYELQNVTSIPEKGTLAKFSTFVRLLRTMTYEQIRRVTSEIYTERKNLRAYAWPVLRDAVATTGTGPALLTIRDWIKTKKISGEEAAEVLATLPRSARTPTNEYITQLFNLVTSPEVMKQPYLNSTAVLAFTNLVRKAQVNKVTAHNHYGVHAFGRFSRLGHMNITERYIPYLAKALRNAVKHADSHSIQVYIRALGNLAHPMILGVFEPYLEGKEQMSTFQRTLMVASLNKLAQTYPKVARRVLFNVYQNQGEAYEVRCAAVFVLMKTSPPAFMLQRMAAFTHKDVSQQVSAAVKTAIESAAALEGPHQLELKKNAYAAVHHLTPKNFGIQYSTSYLKSNMVKEMGLAYLQELSYIGSSDRLTPSSLFLTSLRNVGGMKSEDMAVSLMTSSIDDIADALSEIFEDSHSSKSTRSHKKGKPSDRHSPYTTDYIKEMLNFQPFESDQIEGNILLTAMSTERFFTFDNNTIERIPHVIKEAAHALRSGKSFNYTKLYNQYALTLAFPTETGLPFVYTLKCPTYVSIRGNITAKIQPDVGSASHSSLPLPQTVNASANLQFVYSSRMSAKISFVAPLTHQRYIAGLDKNVQVNLPLRANLSFDAVNDRVNLTLKPLYNRTSSLLFHYSTWPYTAKHNILDLSPSSQSKDHEIVHVRQPHSWVNYFGKNATGFAFRLNYITEQKYLDTKWIFENLQRHDAISYLLYPWAEKNIKMNNINLYLDPRNSTSEAVTITADYSTDEDYEENDSNESESEGSESHENHGKKFDSSIAKPSSSAPISEKRQREFLSKASAGIRNSSTSVLDLAVVFSGKRNITYVATAAYADSDVDEKSRVLFYYKHSLPKPFELCMAYQGKYPNVPLMNYPKALKAKPTSYSDVEIGFGEKCPTGHSQISIKGKAEQTPERKDWLRHTPESQLCMAQMLQGNYLLPVCRNMTYGANLLDYYTYEINYDKLPSALRNYTYKAYSWARYLGFPYLEENVVDVQNKEGKVILELDYENELEALNISLTAPKLNARWKNVRVSPLMRPVLVQHPSTTAHQDFLNKITGDQYTATCTLDGKSINTFDNKTYPARLGKCWHTMMVTKPVEDDSSSSSSSSPDSEDISILAREVSDKKKEIKVVLGDDVFDIKPTGSSSSDENGSAAGYVVYNNQKPLSVSHRYVSEIDDEEGETLATFYALPSGEVVFEAPQHGLSLLYNGYGAHIMANHTYRDDILGLCGTYDGERSTDFTTPKNCIVQYPAVFVASYAILDNTCEGEAKEMQRRTPVPCYRQTATPWEVVREEDYSTGSRSHRNNTKNGNANRKQPSSGCTKYQTVVIEDDSSTCFSMQPQPTCGGKCRPTEEIEKTVPFHCVANSDTSRHYVQMLKKGANPDFSRKQVTKKVKITVPKECKP